MTRNQKILLFVGGGVVLLCLISCAVVLLFFRGIGTAITNSAFKSPEEVQAAAQEIATVDMPAGYSASEGMKILGITMATYKSSRSNVDILLMGMPKIGELTQVDIDQMKKTFDNQYSSQGYQMRVVDTKDITVRGKPAREIISEGTAKGIEVRQITVFFSGKNGMAAIFVTGPLDQWDGASYDRMILSIR